MEPENETAREQDEVLVVTLDGKQARVSVERMQQALWAAVMYDEMHPEETAP